MDFFISHTRSLCGCRFCMLINVKICSLCSDADASKRAKNHRVTQVTVCCELSTPIDEPITFFRFFAAVDVFCSFKCVTTLFSSNYGRPM